ncbi:hypothetical protein QR680_009532 [Steinernema hermaphroditum]|uniref:Uncharacterized protein n=1 Tax=Steinernema hermaphroditum TaxID=289476 RepID=A0AA39IKN4_9BILA|nr:hypothetical protein QR680_009532 [Steinernema hermaphroditum]
MTVQSPLSGLIRFKDSLPSSLWSFVIPTERSPNSAITASIDPRLDIVEQGPFSSVLALHSCQECRNSRPNKNSYSRQRSQKKHSQYRWSRRIPARSREEVQKCRGYRMNHRIMVI